MKYLSDIANDVLRRSAEILHTSVDDLVEEFELGLKPEVDNYARRLVEFSSTKAVARLCQDIGDKLSDGSFSRFTFDTMLAWESPSEIEELPNRESVGKEKEDRKPVLMKGNPDQINDEVPLFYSDIMPLLVDEERNVGQEAFVWLCSVFPLAADVVNARFTFETLTASTASRLHFPSYDRYLKEIDRCIKNLKQQSTPTGVELADDEYILHVDGTLKTQRVVRHIESTSWPGRLTLTNRALYFEASSAISHETALVVDLTDPNVGQQVTAASTGPWGIPLNDKGIIYESDQLSEPLVLEFPEMTSSTRRDLWLALIKEVILMHDFISKLDMESPAKAWDAQARTILGIVRLHAVRELLRIAPPTPTSFLIFSLYDEVPKGDYVLEELSKNVKHADIMHPCSATSILKNLEIASPIIQDLDVREQQKVQQHANIQEEEKNVDVQEEQVSQLTQEPSDKQEERHSIEEFPQLSADQIRIDKEETENDPNVLVDVKELRKLFDKEQQSNQFKEGGVEKDEQLSEKVMEGQIPVLFDEERGNQDKGEKELNTQVLAEELPQLIQEEQLHYNQDGGAKELGNQVVPEELPQLFDEEQHRNQVTNGGKDEEKEKEDEDELEGMEKSSEQFEEECEQKVEQEYSQHVREAASLDSVVNQAREDAKNVVVAKSTTEDVQEEGITNGLRILVELLSPLKEILPWLQRLVKWEEPGITLLVLFVILVIIYKEWVGFSLAALILGGVAYMLWARKQRIKDKYTEVVVDTSSSDSDTSTVDSISTAQDSYNKFQALVPLANTSILKIQSLLVSRSPKHANHVMLIATGIAVILMVIPFKFFVMATILVPFVVTLMPQKPKTSANSNRRLKEWWESIPVIPVRVVDESSKSSK